MFTGCARIAVATALVYIVHAAPASAVKRRAFVTSVAGTGNLTSWSDSGGLIGVAAGDLICKNRALLGGLPNFSGFRAWLSTASTDAYCHVQGQTGKRDPGCVGTPTPAGPWYRYDGVGRFSGTLDELTDPLQPEIYQPIHFDELGNELSQDSGNYWTGTGADGTASDSTCAGWVVGTDGATGRTGTPERSVYWWTSDFTNYCDRSRRLLCVESGTSEVTPVPWVPAALVFSTSALGSGNLGAWPEAGAATGLAAGDAICRNLAAAAHLPSPDAFIAWLSTDSVAAGSRLTLEDTPFRRVDGFRLANSKADLLSSGSANTLHVDEQGQYLAQLNWHWSGSLGGGSASGINCDGWTSSDPGDDGDLGVSDFAYGAEWSAFWSTPCSQPLRLLCMSNREVLFWDGFDLSENTERWSAAAP